MMPTTSSGPLRTLTIAPIRIGLLGQFVGCESGRHLRPGHRDHAPDAVHDCRPQLSKLFARLEIGDLAPPGKAAPVDRDVLITAKTSRPGARPERLARTAGHPGEQAFAAEPELHFDGRLPRSERAARPEPPAH